jgi:hypothetical protein
VVHDRQFPAMAGNAACLQIFPDRPAPARALVAKPFESTLAAQGPTDLQEIGQGFERGVAWRDGKDGSGLETARRLARGQSLHWS